MSNYASKPAESSSQAVKPLDLLPLKRYCGGETDVAAVAAGGGHESKPEDEVSPRLFGVAIGTKRLREGDAAAAESRGLKLQLGGAEVKSEPLDHHRNGDDEQEPWIRQCNRTDQRVCN